MASARSACVAGLQAWSAVLFASGGVVWALIGALTPVMMERGIGRATLVFSGPSDTLAFGAPPREVLETQPAVRLLRRILLRIVGGLLLCGGVMVVALAWFGWRHGAVWAFAALSAVALLAVPYWLLAARPFVQAGVRIRLRDVPPFMWVTTALWLPAIVLGGLALRGA